MVREGHPGGREEGPVRKREFGVGLPCFPNQGECRLQSYQEVEENGG